MTTIAHASGRAALYGAALAALRRAAIPFCFMRGASLEEVEGPDVDLLVDPRRRAGVGATLAGAGFVRRGGPEPPAKAVYVARGAGDFAALDVHFAVVQGWIVFGDARAVLARARPDGAPHAEDLAAMLAGHALLAGRPLEGARLACVRRALPQVAAAFDDPDPAARAALARLWRRRALLSPGLPRSLAALARLAANRLGFAGRAVTVALLAPDGAGKTALIAELEARLAAGPLAAKKVYMGCWGGYRLPLRFLSRLAPHEPRASIGPAKRLVREAKRWAFFGLLAAELAARYLVLVRGAKTPVVICDRYLEDVHVDNGLDLVAPGLAGRALLRLFPRPDFVLYLDRDAEEACAAKDDLTPEQYRRNDRAYRGAIAARLPPDRVVVVRVDAPAAALAERVIERHWRDLAGAGPQNH